MKKNLNYTFLWQIGTGVCAVIYYSGICWFYLFVRKNILKRFRTIVLTYHRIRNDRTCADISVSVEHFERQMAFLRNEFDIVPLMDAVQSFKNKQTRTMNKDKVSITFDDGYRDNYTNAFPIVQKLGIFVTIFLIIQFINNHAEYLTIDELLEMKKGTINYGSHTMTHQILSELDVASAQKEITDSKEHLHTLLNNEEIQFFAYPKGKKRHSNEFIVHQVEAAGYTAAFSTENGTIENSRDLFFLHRIGMRDCPHFVFKVRVSGILESRLVYGLRSLLHIT